MIICVHQWERSKDIACFGVTVKAISLYRITTEASLNVMNNLCQNHTI